MAESYKRFVHDSRTNTRKHPDFDRMAGKLTEEIVGRAAERIVVRNLTDEGYVINAWNTAPAGPADVDATRGRLHVLVQVRSAVYPNEPADFTDEEAQALILRATAIRATPMIASIQFKDATLEVLTLPVLYSRVTQ